MSQSGGGGGGGGGCVSVAAGVLRPLPAALAEKAAKELNEHPAEVPLYLDALRQWARQQTHLRARTSDQFLIVFLRAAKYNLAKAKERLHNFYVYRASMPEVFAARNINDAKWHAINAAGGLLYVPQPVAPTGPRVVLMRPNCFDMNVHSIPDVFKMGAMFADLLLYRDDNAIVAGYIFVMDLAALPAAVLLNFDPRFARKMTVLVNKALPTRMKSFHFLHVPGIFEKFFNMVKSVINAKLRDRFYVHSNLNTLYKHIPPHILPREYGGEADMHGMQQFVWDMLQQNAAFFMEEQNYGLCGGGGDTMGSIADAKTKTKKPTKRNPSKCGGSDDTKFGIAGTFRKLNLD